MAEQWAKVEIMGHRTRVGRISEVEMFGGKLMQIEPIDDDGAVKPTEFYGASAIFCITHTTEAEVLAEVERVKAQNAAWAERRARVLTAPDDDDDENNPGICSGCEDSAEVRDRHDRCDACAEDWANSQLGAGPF